MQTRKLTIQMAHQDGTPFAGYASVRLSSASKTDEELVGPLVWQEAEFKNGIIELQLVPNSELEEGTFYKCQIYVVKIANGYKSKSKVVDTAFTMPDTDSSLHDLAVIEPVKPSAEDVLRTIASEATQAAVQAEAARDELEGAIGRIGVLEDRADALEIPLADSFIDGIFLAPPEEGTGAAYLNGVGLAHFLSKLESEQASEYATKAEVQAVDAKASSAYHAKGSVPTVADLPASGNEQGDVWNVSSSLDGDNYVWTGTAWDKLGGTIDLSPYAIDAGVVHLAGAETIDGTKTFSSTIVGSVSGNAGTVNGHSVASDVPANAVFTDTTYAPATQSADGLMASTDKVKLDGVEAGANAYVLPEATALELGGVTIISDAQIDALFGIGGE